LTRSPEHLPLNPAAIKRFIDTGGRSASVVSGSSSATCATTARFPSQVDAQAFTVGENLATTEGAVVFRNEVLELIQYAPRTDEVHERRCSSRRPQINKFYVFDLSRRKASSATRSTRVSRCSW